MAKLMLSTDRKKGLKQRGRQHPRISTKDFQLGFSCAAKSERWDMIGIKCSRNRLVSCLCDIAEYPFREREICHRPHVRAQHHPGAACCRAAIAL